MQAAHAKAQRVVHALRADLDLLESGRDTSVGVQGRVSASLTTLDRHLRDLQEWAAREMDPERRDEAKEIRDEGQQLRRSLERFKARDVQRVQEQRERDELLRSQQQQQQQSNGDGGQLAATVLDVQQDHMARQSSSLHRSVHQVDEYLSMGQESLVKLREQGVSLKSAQRKILDVANTLGLSQTTIRWIERRTSEDKWVFWGGVVITLIVMYYVLRWVGRL